MRLIVLIVLALFLPSISAANWDEQDFSLFASLSSKQAENGETLDKLHQINVGSSFVYLFDGISSTASLKASKQHFELEGLDKEERDSYEFDTGLRYFINEFSNVDVLYGINDQQRIADPISFRFFTVKPRIINVQDQYLTLNFTLGSDQTLRSINFSATLNDSESTDGIGGNLLRQQKSLEAHLGFDNRFTEDSFWSADIVLRSGEYGSSNDLTERTYVDGRLGFRTRYLGNSSVSVLVGVSNQDESDLLDSNTGSWNITNTLNITNNLSFVVTSIRQFDYSDNPNFSTSDQTTNDVKIDFSVTEQLSTNFALQSVRNEYSAEDWSEDNSVLIQANYLYNDHLLIFFEAEYSELKGNQTEFNLDKQSVSLGIKYELL